MFKRAMLLALATGLLCASGWAITPNQPPPRTKKMERLNQKLLRLGSGEDSLVAVKLKDKSAIAGHVEVIGDDSFTLIDRNTGEARKVAYQQVDKLQGFNIESREEVHEGTGVRAKLVRAALYLLPGHQIPSNSLSGGGKTLLIGVILGIILAIILAKAL